MLAMWMAIRQQLNSPRRLLMWGVVTNLVFVLMFYAVEQKGLEESFWWGWVTGFTIGYGDVYPVTSLGRGIGIANMLTNFVLLQFMTAHIIHGVFVDDKSYGHEEQEADKYRIRNAELIAYYNAVNQRAFMRFQGFEPVGPEPELLTEEQLWEDLVARGLIDAPPASPSIRKSKSAPLFKKATSRARVSDD